MSITLPISGWRHNTPNKWDRGKEMAEEETFEQFQRRLHCGQVSWDDLEKWYYEQGKELAAARIRIVELESEIEGSRLSSKYMEE